MRRHAKGVYIRQHARFPLCSIDSESLEVFYSIHFTGTSDSIWIDKSTASFNMDTKTQPINTAAWLRAENTPLEIGPAPYTLPGPNELLIKNHAIALNPVDRMVQAMSSKVMPWIKPSFILGHDVAGEVIAVGSGVTRFQPGDRVLGNAVGSDKRSNRSSEGAFQHYVILRSHLTAPIPDTLSYDRACVLPLCLSTAAASLFQKTTLNLTLPTSTPSTIPSAPAPSQDNSTLLVWGASTSVGANAIQLGVAAGYTVIATCSAANFPFVRRLGASHAFDYRSASAVADITALMRASRSAGAVAIGDGAVDACIDILAACPSGSRAIAAVSVPQPATLPPRGFAMVRFLCKLLAFFARTWVKGKVRGVKTHMVWGTDVMEGNVGRAIYEDFLPRALQDGRFVAAPEPLVAGKGLESIQEGLEMVWKGVSARKVVVLLE
jgi:NADPH:quinone reductase-like Zn-dependent oxidoreductase